MCLEVLWGYGSKGCHDELVWNLGYHHNSDMSQNPGKLPSIIHETLIKNPVELEYTPPKFNSEFSTEKWWDWKTNPFLFAARFKF